MSLAGCRIDPATLVAEDARTVFMCETIEVQYAGSYDASTPNTSIELYEASSDCGEEATYRCEIYDDGTSTDSSCCRFGEADCG